MTCAPPVPSPSSTGAPPAPIDEAPDMDTRSLALGASPVRDALRDLRARAGRLLATAGLAAAGVWRRCRGRPSPPVADGLVVEALLADRRRARNLERRLREGLVRLRRALGPGFPDADGGVAVVVQLAVPGGRPLAGACHAWREPDGRRRVLLRLALQVGRRRLGLDELLAVLTELVVLAGQHAGADGLDGLVVPVELWPEGPEHLPPAGPRPADPLAALGPAGAPPPRDPPPNGHARGPRPARRAPPTAGSERRRARRRASRGHRPPGERRPGGRPTTEPATGPGEGGHRWAAQRARPSPPRRTCPARRRVAPAGRAGEPAVLDLTPFTPEQREVVLAGEGPLLVVAGPGSGKTAVLAARIAYLVRARGVPPEAVLALTFTAAAARRLRARLGVYLAGDAAAVPVRTFHALGLSLLRRWPEALGFPRAGRGSATPPRRWRSSGGRPRRPESTRTGGARSSWPPPSSACAAGGPSGRPGQPAPASRTSPAPTRPACGGWARWTTRPCWRCRCASSRTARTPSGRPGRPPRRAGGRGPGPLPPPVRPRRAAGRGAPPPRPRGRPPPGRVRLEGGRRAPAGRLPAGLPGGAGGGPGAELPRHRPAGGGGQRPGAALGFPATLWTANPPGEPARLLAAADERAEARAIAAEVVRLGRERGLPPGGVAVLYRTRRQAGRSRRAWPSGACRAGCGPTPPHWTPTTRRPPPPQPMGGRPAAGVAAVGGCCWPRSTRPRAASGRWSSSPASRRASCPTPARSLWPAGRASYPGAGPTRRGPRARTDSPRSSAWPSSPRPARAPCSTSATAAPAAPATGTGPGGRAGPPASSASSRPRW